MLTPKSALGLARSLLIYYGQPWKTRRMRRLYARWIQPGSLAFDIGAHVGNRTRVWRHLGARVVALEPQPLFAAWLRRQFGRTEGVTLIEAAAGATPGHTTLYISSRTPTVSSVAADWVEHVGPAPGFEQVTWDRAQTVRQITLAELIAEFGRPAFCKIDVEGHEAAVLDGLDIPLPALSFEMIPATVQVALDCVARLAQLGHYRYAVSPGESLTLGRWQTADEVSTWLKQRRAEENSADIFAELLD